MPALVPYVLDAKMYQMLFGSRTSNPSLANYISDYFTGTLTDYCRDVDRRLRRRQAARAVSASEILESLLEGKLREDADPVKLWFLLETFGQSFYGTELPNEAWGSVKVAQLKKLSGLRLFDVGIEPPLPPAKRKPIVFRVAMKDFDTATAAVTATAWATPAMCDQFRGWTEQGLSEDKGLMFFVY